MAAARLNGVKPLAWLADVFERLVSGWTKVRQPARLVARA
jgi:hypothetical protein